MLIANPKCPHGRRLNEPCVACEKIDEFGRKVADRIAELEVENARTKKELTRMVKFWRDYASGHYCQTYNTGMAQGLNSAADSLEEYLQELN